MQYGEHSRIATGFRKPFSLNKFSLEKKELAWYDTCPWKARGLLISSLVQQIAATALKRKCVLAQLWQFQSKKSAQKKKRKEKGGPETGSWPRRRPHIYSAKQWDSFYTWSCPGAGHLFTCNHSIHPLLEMKHANSSTVRTNYFAFSSEISANSFIFFFLLHTITQSILKPYKWTASSSRACAI